MLVLLSPAKTLDLTSPLPTRKHTMPRLLDRAEALIDILRTLSPDDVASLMHLSPELAQLNVERYRDFEVPFTRRNARPAMLMFAGDVYQGLQAAARFDGHDWNRAQKTIRILSGLYGILLPLDLIAPYRLEMGTALATPQGRTLYEHWGTTLRDLLQTDLADSPGSDTIINLASTEYATAAHLDDLDARIVTPRFEDQNPAGEWKVMSFPAKRARGMMAGWIVTQRLNSTRLLKNFDEGGYVHQPQLSTPDVPVFRRRRA